MRVDGCAEHSCCVPARVWLVPHQTPWYEEDDTAATVELFVVSRTNLTSIAHTLVMRQPAVRRFAGMPALPAIAAPTTQPQGGQGGMLSGFQGMLGMTPQAAAVATPQAPPPREVVLPNTDISLSGSQPLARQAHATAKASKAKAKKRRR